MSDTPSALDGLTVVDLSTGRAAALASMFLADNGARVVRVVSRHQDVVRDSDIFAVYDRGKEVTLLDPHTDAETIGRMSDAADVVLEDLPPSASLRDTLGLHTLTSRNQGVVHCSITAYGTYGPLKDDPADHDLVAARTGVLPWLDGRPVHIVHPIAYVGAGLLAAAGIVSKLFQRERTGRGGRVETSLMAGALLYMLKCVVGAAPDGPANPTVLDPQGGAPFYSVFECADGRWVQLGGLHSGFVELAAAVLGLSEMIASDPQFRGGWGYRDDETRKRLFNAVAEMMRTRTADEWVADLQASDVPCDVTRTPDEAMSDPQIVHNGLVHELDDPKLGATEMLGLPIRLSGTPGRVTPRAGAVTSHDASDPCPQRAEQIYSSDELPLAGVRVMEMTNLIAGPLAGRLLADLGAEVVKFEPPSGDLSRPAGSPMFLALNANKRSVSANTKTDEGREVARRLAESSDVMLANMRPGATDRMRLDAETLARLNPLLVQTHITAYGWDGPYARRPGVDPIAQAISGLQHAQGGHDRPPVYLNALAPCDYAGGALGALGAALGLLARERFGIGQKVDTNLLASGSIVNADGFMRYEGRERRRVRTREGRGLGPLRRFFRTSDGWISVVADDVDHAASRIESAMGAADGSCEAELEALFAGVSSEAALESLTSHGVPCAPVGGYGTDFFADPQAEANGMIVSLDHPKLGAVSFGGNFVTIDGSDTLPKRHTPMLGEHTAETLSKLGYTEDEIRSLYDSGVVKTETPE